MAPGGRHRFQERFIEQARSRLRLASSAFGQAAAAHTVRTELHALLGEASMFGFHDVAALARAGEQVAHHWEVTSSSESRARCLGLVRELDQLIQSFDSSNELHTAFAPPTPTGVAASRTVLVLDDSPIVLMATTDVLEAAGFAVCELDDPRQLAEALRRCRPDVLLTDLNMPGLAIEQVVRIAAGVPVYLYSGAPTEELERIAALIGAAGVIAKTHDAAALANAVARCFT